MKKLVCLLLSLQFLLVAPAFAQSDDAMENTWNDIYVVGGAGAAGAILGLSTLSFVKKPTDHLSNIWTGAAIGVIVGVIYVAYTSAIRGTEELSSTSDFQTKERVAWHESNTSILTPQKVQFGTEFLRLNF